MNDNKPLTVVFVGAKTYPPKIGGIETHIYNLSQEFKSSNVHTLIFVGKNGEKSYEKVDDLLEIFRVYQSKNRYLLKISMVIPVLNQLRILKKSVDIYHAHDSVFGFFLSILGYRPLVYTAHGCAFLRSDWPIPIKQILKFMESTIFKKADAVICVDYKTKEVVERYRDKDIYVIPNGVKPEKFKDLLRPPEYPKDKLIIFSAGRLIPSKGFQDLIEAYLLLSDKAKNIAELFIAGEGPLLETLRNKASVDKRIHVLGYVPQIEPYFAHADIFVLPSHYEGFPFTLLEAMGAKTACISTDVGDISNRFENGKELIIVSPRNTKRLAYEIEKLIEDEELRNTLAINGFNKIVQIYSWKNITKHILHLYSLLSCRKQ